MWAAPAGAFGALAFTVGKFGWGSLVQLGALIGEFYAVSSRGHIIYQGSKVAFYGTFHT